MIAQNARPNRQKKRIGVCLCYRGHNLETRAMATASIINTKENINNPIDAT